MGRGHESLACKAIAEFQVGEKERAKWTSSNIEYRERMNQVWDLNSQGSRGWQEIGSVRPRASCSKWPTFCYRHGTVKNCEVPVISPHLEANTVESMSFLDAGRRHRLLGQVQRTLLLTTQPAAWASAYLCQSPLTSSLMGWCERAQRCLHCSGVELGEHKPLIMGRSVLSLCCRSSVSGHSPDKHLWKDYSQQRTVPASLIRHAEMQEIRVPTGNFHGL